MKIGALDFRSMFPQQQPQPQDSMQRQGLLAERAENANEEQAQEDTSEEDGFFYNLLYSVSNSFAKTSDETDFFEKAGGFEEFKAQLDSGIESADVDFRYSAVMEVYLEDFRNYKDDPMTVYLYPVPDDGGVRGTYMPERNQMTIYYIAPQEVLDAVQSADPQGDNTELEYELKDLALNRTGDTDFHEFIHSEQVGGSFLSSFLDYEDHGNEVEAYVAGAAQELILGALNAETAADMESVLASVSYWDEDEDIFADNIYEIIISDHPRMNRGRSDTLSVGLHREVVSKQRKLIFNERFPGAHYDSRSG